MTEEEIKEQSEKYAREHHGTEDDEKLNLLRVISKYSFQAGAKWGIVNAIEWHDLRKNPDDLPKNRENVLLYVKLHDKWEREVILVGYRDYGDCLGVYCKDWGYVEPIQNVKYDFVDNEEVIAWCELPQFKDKE